MGHPSTDILHYLGQLLVQLYLHHHVSVSALTKTFFSKQLMHAIAEHWHFAYELLPSEETFYRALRKGMCSTAMKEKLAILYFAFIDKDGAAQISSAFLSLIKRKRMSFTPNWDRFVAEYEKHCNKTQHSTLPPHLHHWLAHLSDKDYNRLAKEIAKRKRKSKEQRAKSKGQL